jgi:hypothetical protein
VADKDSVVLCIRQFHRDIAFAVARGVTTCISGCTVYIQLRADVEELVPGIRLPDICPGQGSMAPTVDFLILSGQLLAALGEEAHPREQG